MNTKISEAAVEAARDAYTVADTRGIARTAPMRVALEAALPHLQGEAVPVAWKYRAPGKSFWRVSFHRPVSAEWESEPLFDHPQPAELSESAGVDGWAIAEKVRTDLDRQACPDAYMRIAVESVVEHLAAAGKQQVEEVQGDARAQFEAWALGLCSSVKMVGRFYDDPQTRGAWEAWKYLTRAASRQPVGSEPVGEIDEGENGRYVDLYPNRELPIGAKVYAAEPAQGIDLWQPIETAPKSVADGRSVDGIYLLGIIPDSDMVDPQACIDVIWWEPLLVNRNGGRGRWQSTRFGDEVKPTHWMPLPTAPLIDGQADTAPGVGNA